MARGKIGSFNDTVTAGTNMVEVFKENEKDLPNKWPHSQGFSIQKIAISADPGTVFTLNGAEITLPSTGIFETDVGMIEIESLVFEEAVPVCIVYLY